MLPRNGQHTMEFSETMYREIDQVRWAFGFPPTVIENVPSNQQWAVVLATDIRELV